MTILSFATWLDSNYNVQPDTLPRFGIIRNRSLAIEPEPLLQVALDLHFLRGIYVCRGLARGRNRLLLSVCVTLVLESWR